MILILGNHRKRKSTDATQTLSAPSVAKRSTNAPVTRSVNILNTRKGLQKKETSLIPRLTRLSCQEGSLEGICVLLLVMEFL